MTTKRVKKKEHEKLTDQNISYVIDLLAMEKPITKREACEILNISYNTARLDTILTNWKEDQERKKKRRAEKRGKPISDSEICTIVERKLSGDSLKDISESIYRSTAQIQLILENVGVPEKATGDDKYKPSILPEECISEEFQPGEIAWSAVHHTSCEIIQKLDEKYVQKYGVPCYKVWIKEKSKEDNNFSNINGGYYAYLEAYNIGKLSHLEKFGINKKNI